MTETGSPTPPTFTSSASPGQDDRRAQLLRTYDHLDDAAKQVLLKFALDLLEQRAA